MCLCLATPSATFPEFVAALSPVAELMLVGKWPSICHCNNLRHCDVPRPSLKGAVCGYMRSDPSWLVTVFHLPSWIAFVSLQQLRFFSVCMPLVPGSPPFVPLPYRFPRPTTAPSLHPSALGQTAYRGGGYFEYLASSSWPRLLSFGYFAQTAASPRFWHSSSALAV